MSIWEENNATSNYSCVIYDAVLTQGLEISMQCVRNPRIEFQRKNTFFIKKYDRIGESSPNLDPTTGSKVNDIDKKGFYIEDQIIKSTRTMVSLHNPT